MPETAAEKRKREKAEAEAAAAAEAALLEADNIVMEGAVGGPVAPVVPENIASYFDSRIQEILKSISVQLKSINTKIKRSKKETGDNMENSCSWIWQHL